MEIAAIIFVAFVVIGLGCLTALRVISHRERKQELSWRKGVKQLPNGGVKVFVYRNNEEIEVKNLLHEDSDIDRRIALEDAEILAKELNDSKV